MEGEQRGRRHGGGERERPGLGEQCGHAAADGGFAQRRRERQQADHRGERELPAGIGRCPRVQRERHRGREPEGVPARRRAPGEGGDEPRGAHDAGALDGRAAPGERHVDGDHRDRHDEPRPQPEPARRPGGEHEQREEHDVLPAHGEQVGQPGAPEVLADVRLDQLVLPEHHAAQQRRLRGRQRPLEPPLGAAAHRVERAGKAAAARAGGAQDERVERGACAAAALVGVVAPERPDAPAHGDDRPGLRPRARRGDAQLQDDLFARCRPAQQPCPRRRRPEPVADGLGQFGARRQVVAVQRRQHAGVERREARLAADGARQHGNRGRHAEAADGEHGGSRRGGPRDPARPARGEQPGDEAEQQDVPRMQARAVAQRREAAGCATEDTGGERHAATLGVRP